MSENEVQNETGWEPQQEGPETLEHVRSQLKQVEKHNARLLRAVTPPEIWTEAERDGMHQAFIHAHEVRGRGVYESLFAVAHWILQHRADTFRRGGYSQPSPENPTRTRADD